MLILLLQMLSDDSIEVARDLLGFIETRINSTLEKEESANGMIVKKY